MFNYITAETDAQLLRKKLYLENQKIQENKLSLAQINSRLSELRGKRNELEEERRALLKQKQATEYALLKTTDAELVFYNKKSFDDLIVYVLLYYVLNFVK